MKTIIIEEFGSPEVLKFTETSTPKPQDNQVLIRVHFIGMLTLDTMIRRGDDLKEHFSITLPTVLGNGISGTIVATGRKISQELLGRKILAHIDNGAYAEYTVANINNIALIDDTTPEAAALTLLHDATTALFLMENAQVTKRHSVAIFPSTGCLGGYLIQLCAIRGASVTAIMRDKNKALWAKGFVTEILDTTQIISDIDTYCDHFDIVFDGAAGEFSTTLLQILHPTGIYSNFGNASGKPGIKADTVLKAGKKYLGMDQLSNTAQNRFTRLGSLITLLTNNEIISSPVQIFPFSQVSQAHAALENREITGKALLEIV